MDYCIGTKHQLKNKCPVRHMVRKATCHPYLVGAAIIRRRRCVSVLQLSQLQGIAELFVLVFQRKYRFLIRVEVIYDPPRPKHMPCHRSNTVWAEACCDGVQDGHTSAFTPRLRRYWKGGENAQETLVPSHQSSPWKRGRDVLSAPER
jgi:hypothetical protein